MKKILSTFPEQLDRKCILHRTESSSEGGIWNAVNWVLILTPYISGQSGFCSDILTVVGSVILHRDPEDMDDIINMQQNKLSQVGVLLSIIDERLSQVDERLSQVDERLSQVDERLCQVDELLGQVDELFSQVDVLFSQVDELISG